MRALIQIRRKGLPVSNTPDYKRMARRLRGELADAGMPVSHGQALEYVAHLHGARDWNTLAATASDRPESARAPAAADIPAAVPVQVHEVVPFLHPSSMTASLAFYQGVLGFRIALCWPSSDDIRWCRLKLGNAAIMLQEPSRRPGEAARPAGRLGDGLSLNFTCSNALAVYDTAVAAGLSLEEPFVGNHMWVVVLHDPDGCRIEFESNTLAPEEATLSQVRAAT
jgi:lactoylglutathione lyase